MQISDNSVVRRRAKRESVYLLQIDKGTELNFYKCEDKIHQNVLGSQTRRPWFINGLQCRYGTTQVGIHVREEFTSGAFRIKGGASRPRKR